MTVIVPFIPHFLGVSGIALSGILPRVGPGRAWLAMRSRFSFEKTQVSLRVNEIKDIKIALNLKESEGGCLIVTGEKGVGKTCLIDTMAKGMFGVVRGMPGDDADTIVNNTLHQITGLSSRVFQPATSVHRVLFFYRLFGGNPLNKTGDPCTHIIPAVRTLVDDYMLKVIVDSGQNSLVESVTRIRGVEVYNIEQMTHGMIQRIPELFEFHAIVKESGLQELLWRVIGGVPMSYHEIWKKFKRELIGMLICEEIGSAIHLIIRSRGANPVMTEIIELYRSSGLNLKVETVTDKKLYRPTIDIVFKKIKKEGVFLLVPVSNALAIVLGNNLKRIPSLAELIELV